MILLISFPFLSLQQNCYCGKGEERDCYLDHSWERCMVSGILQLLRSVFITSHGDIKMIKTLHLCISCFHPSSLDFINVYISCIIWKHVCMAILEMTIGSASAMMMKHKSNTSVAWSRHIALVTQEIWNKKGCKLLIHHHITLMQAWKQSSCAISHVKTSKPDLTGGMITAHSLWWYLNEVS